MVLIKRAQSFDCFYIPETENVTDLGIGSDAEGVGTPPGENLRHFQRSSGDSCCYGVVTHPETRGRRGVGH